METLTVYMGTLTVSVGRDSLYGNPDSLYVTLVVSNERFTVSINPLPNETVIETHIPIQTAIETKGPQRNRH
jgi:hypothetical protein